MSWLYVALGGALGALMRYGAGMLLNPVGRFPVATLAVNGVGSAALGLLAAWLVTRGQGGSGAIGLFLGVGVLGGFTTFSTFSMDTIALLHAGRTGLAVLNIVANLACGLIGAALGWGVGRGLFTGGV